MRLFFKEKKTDLTQEQLRQISLSALIIKVNRGNLYTLSPGLGKGSTLILKDWWDIRDTVSASQTMDWLLNKGHSFYFRTICDAFEKECEYINREFFMGKLDFDEIFIRCLGLLAEIRGGSTPDSPRISEMQRVLMYRFMVVLESAYQQGYTDVNDGMHAYEMLCGLEKEYPAILKAGLFSGFAEIKNIGMLAWDMGRAVFVARLCFEAGLFRAEQAWEYIRIAYDHTAAEFASWEDFGKSYILGRDVWQGSNDGNRDKFDFVKLYQWMLGNPESPWCKAALK